MVRAPRGGPDIADVTAEYRRVQSAYEQPTLTLISRPSSAAILAIFRTMFSTEKPTIPTGRMHDQVDSLLADLRRADLPVVPTSNGRDACRKWMRDGWLSRTSDADLRVSLSSRLVYHRVPPLSGR